MDPRDGHRERLHCLGVAHLVEDSEIPCPAAAELSLEERRRKARLVEETTQNKMAAHPPPSKPKEGRHASKWSKSLKRDHSPDHDHSGKSAHKRQLSPEKRGQQEDTQIQILAAIQSLSDQLTRIAAQRPVAGSSSGVQEPLRSHHISQRGKVHLMSSHCMLTVPLGGAPDCLEMLRRIWEVCRTMRPQLRMSRGSEFSGGSVGRYFSAPALSDCSSGGRLSTDS